MILRAVIWGVLAASNVEQQAFDSVLKLLGYQVRYARGTQPGLLVIPSTERLSASQAAQVQDFIRQGGDAILCGPETIADVLGVQFDPTTITVKDVTDLAHPDRYLRWNPTATVRRFAILPGATVLLHDQPTHQALAFFGQLGKGRYLALAASFDTSSPLGTSRYPYFAEYLKRAFDYRPLVTRPAIEAYFDPGFRQGADIAQLAATWRQSGIRIIYAATWYDIDYVRLIEQCHRQGIAVYAWFTPPMISPKFWDEHPPWRAARTGWRYPMNLEIPEARAAAYAFIKDMLKRYDWDGVNLAEMNFDTPGGSSERITALHRDLLQHLAGSELDIIVTMLDSLHSPRLKDAAGIDSREIVKLMRRFPFTLQVEDAFEHWSTPPSRYTGFASAYQRIVPQGRLMFDVNVVPDRDVEKTHLPSALATGTEFLHTLRAAGASGRVAVYSESTVAPQDWDFAAAALATETKLTEESGGLRVRSKRMVKVQGQFVPPGNHLIPSPVKTMSVNLQAISCDLLSLQPTSTGMRFTYDSPGCCAAAFDKSPSRIVIDGVESTGTVFPRGKHRVEVEVR